MTVKERLNKTGILQVTAVSDDVKEASLLALVCPWKRNDYIRTGNMKQRSSHNRSPLTRVEYQMVNVLKT